MPFELSLAWVIHGILAVLLLVIPLSFARPGYRQAHSSRLSRAVWLPLSESTAVVAERRILRNTVAMSAGGILGLLVSAVVLFVVPDGAGPSRIWLVTLPATLTGMSAGGALIALGESLFPRRPEAVRVARATEVGIHDYLSPKRLRTPTALLSAAGVLFLTGLVLGTTGVIDGAVFLRSPAVAMLAVALLVLAGSTILARQLLRRPQPAGSELELAWDDAFRADTLRSLWLFGSIIAWLAIAATGVGILQGLDALAGTSWSTGLGSQLFIWGFLVILFTFSNGGAQSYFRFRLWPELATEPPTEVPASDEGTGAAGAGGSRGSAEEVTAR